MDFHVPGDTFYAIWGTEDDIISETDRTLITNICNPKHIDIRGDHAFSGEHATHELNNALQHVIK